MLLFGYRRIPHVRYDKVRSSCKRADFLRAQSVTYTVPSAQVLNLDPILYLDASIDILLIVAQRPPYSFSFSMEVAAPLSEFRLRSF